MTQGFFADIRHLIFVELSETVPICLRFGPILSHRGGRFCARVGLCIGNPTAVHFTQHAPIPVIEEMQVEVGSEKDELDDFYVALKSETTVASFLKRYRRIIQLIHEEGLTEDYRLARGRVKKLCDEVSPVARFVRTQAASEDRIWFALDNTAPDCCVRHGDGRLREIEVTVAQAKERLNVMTELNQTGIGRGYVGLSDDASKEDFVRRMAQPRIAYSTEEIVDSIICAVAVCARKKRKSQGDTLLIEAPLETLPANRWGDFRPHLADKVKELTFREVYVTGRSEHDICLRIK